MLHGGIEGLFMIRQCVVRIDEAGASAFIRNVLACERSARPLCKKHSDCGSAHEPMFHLDARSLAEKCQGRAIRLLKWHCATDLRYNFRR